MIIKLHRKPRLNLHAPLEILVGIKGRVRILSSRALHWFHKLLQHIGQDISNKAMLEELLPENLIREDRSR